VYTVQLLIGTELFVLCEYSYCCGPKPHIALLVGLFCWVGGVCQPEKDGWQLVWCATKNWTIGRICAAAIVPVTTSVLGAMYGMYYLLAYLFTIHLLLSTCLMTLCGEKIFD